MNICPTTSLLSLADTGNTWDRYSLACAAWNVNTNAFRLENSNHFLYEVCIHSPHFLTPLTLFI